MPPTKIERTQRSGHLAWIDLEMTGLDSNRDVILQAALIVTDAELRPLEEYVCDVWQPEAALAGMVVYGLAALLVFRKRDGWRGGRAAALLTIAALWVAAAVLVPRGQWRVLAQDVALAAVFAHRGWRLRKRA